MFCYKYFQVLILFRRTSHQFIQLYNTPHLQQPTLQQHIQPQLQQRQRHTRQQHIQQQRPRHILLK